jgi:Bacterial Ig-like domain
MNAPYTISLSCKLTMETLNLLKENVMQSKPYLSSRKKLRWLFSLGALFFVPLLLAAQCNHDLPPSGAVKITGFTASPASLPATGGNVTLSWTTEGATTLSIDQGVGTVTGTSVIVNNLTVTKTFTLTASNGADKATAKTTVTLNPNDKDTTPPQIVSLTPVNGSKDVAGKGPFVVIFSEAIKADTVTNSSVSVTVTDGINGSATLELSGDGKTLTITPLNAIQPGNTVTVKLEPTLTDLAGNALQTSPWSFEVPFWHTISNALDVTPDNFAFQPSIAVSSDGNLFVAWYEQDRVTNQTRVYVKQWDGTTWQGLGDALNTTSTNSASNPSLVVDSQNHPSVAFQENDSVTGDNSIYVKRWNGSTWITAGAAVATGSAEHPSLAIGKDVLGVAYTNTNGTNKAVYVKLLDGTWKQVGTELNDVKTQNADYPSLALYESQRLGELVPFIAFQESDGTSNNIYVKQWSDMAKDWLKLDDELDVAVAKEAQHPSLRLLRDSPIVAWQEDGSSNGDIYVKAFNGMTWDAIGNDDYKTQDSSEPFFATSSQDSSTPPPLVWRGSNSNGQNVYAKYFDSASAGWSSFPPTGLKPFNTPGKAAENPEMTFGASSLASLYVAFAEFDSTTSSTNLVVKRYNIPAPEPQ